MNPVDKFCHPHTFVYNAIWTFINAAATLLIYSAWLKRRKR